MTTMHGCTAVRSRLIRSIEVSSFQGGNPIEIKEVYTREEMPVGKGHIPTKENLKQNHSTRAFSDLTPELIEGLEVGLLIGVNCPGALVPLSVQSGQSPQDPFAVQLRHGWVVIGPHASGPEIGCHRISVFGSRRSSGKPSPEAASCINPEFNDGRKKAQKPLEKSKKGVDVGRDWLVRRVEVRTAEPAYLRPIHESVKILPFEEQSIVW